jgi:hypothetical protein
MKKILSLLVIGLAILFLLSFIPSNTLDQDISLGGGDNFALTVPAAPPKTPPRK